MNNAKNRMILWAGLLSLLLYSAQGVTVFNEDFNGTQPGAIWDFYRTSDMWDAAVVTDGVFRVSVDQTATSIAGLVLDQPIAVGDNSQLDIYIKYKPNATAGSFLLNFGILTGDPGGPDGGSEEGWAWFESWCNSSGSVTPSATRIRLNPGGETYNTSHGVVTEWSNNSDTYLRLQINTSVHTFKTFVSNDGASWTLKGDRNLTVAEQAQLETHAYYLLMRLVTFSSTATIDIDRIWAETTVDLPEGITFNEDFEDNTLASKWDFYYTANQWSDGIVTNGVFRTFVDQTGTTIAGLALNTPIAAGHDKKLSVYFKYKPLSCRSTFMVSLGMVTEDPLGADGTDAAGWAYFVSSKNDGGFVNNAYSRLRIKVPPASQNTTWDAGHGLIGEFRNGSYCYFRMEVDGLNHTLKTFVSDDGLTWTAKGSRDMTADEQTYFEAEEYYLLIRLIGYGAAYLDIDRIWAETTPPAPDGTIIIIR